MLDVVAGGLAATQRESGRGSALEPPAKLPMNRRDLDNGPPRIVILLLRRRRLHAPPVCTANLPPLLSQAHCRRAVSHTALHTAHCSERACSPRPPSPKLPPYHAVALRDPGRPPPYVRASSAPRYGSIRHRCSIPRSLHRPDRRCATGSLPPYPPPVQAFLRRHPNPTPSRSRQAVQLPSSAPPSSCPARPLESRGDTLGHRARLGVPVDAHAVPAASPGLRRPARSHKTPCRPL
jgi:hypothetical protein